MKKIEPNNIIFLNERETKHITSIRVIFRDYTDSNPIEYGWSKRKKSLPSVAAESSEIWILVDRSLCY